MPTKTTRQPGVTFALRLEAIRAAKDAQAAKDEKPPWTPYRLAKLAGIGPTHLYALLAGKSIPSWPVVQALAKALDVSTDELRDSDPSKYFRKKAE